MEVFARVIMGQGTKALQIIEYIFTVLLKQPLNIVHGVQQMDAAMGEY